MARVKVTRDQLRDEVLEIRRFYAAMHDVSAFQKRAWPHMVPEAEVASWRARRNALDVVLANLDGLQEDSALGGFLVDED